MDPIESPARFNECLLHIRWTPISLAPAGADERQIEAFYQLGIVEQI